MNPTNLQPQSIGTGTLDLHCSILIPPNFTRVELPAEPFNFVSASESAPLAVFSLAPEDILIAVAVRPAYETGSVLQWMHYLTEHFCLTVESMHVQSIGVESDHKAIVAFAIQTDESDRPSHRLVIVGLEDGGRFVTAHARVPLPLWDGLADQIEASVMSLSVKNARGATHDLESMTAPGWKRISAEEWRQQSLLAAQERRERREPAIVEARRLLRDGEFTKAEQAVTAADQSIEGAVALARLYESELRRRVGERPPAKREELEPLYHKALHWALSTYPDPHTREESDAYESGRAGDRARLAEILEGAESRADSY